MDQHNPTVPTWAEQCNKRCDGKDVLEHRNFGVFLKVMFLGGLGGGCMSVSLCVSYVHGKGRREELKDNGLIQVINKNQKFINI